MKKLFFLALLFPLVSLARQQQIYIKLTDASGRSINGTAVARGFENTIEAQTVNAGGKDNRAISFTMNISGASADLRKAMMDGSFLSTGLITVLQPSTTKPAYTIKMEKIKVSSVSETAGCNGGLVTTIGLQATRIGWTYYQQNRSGANVVSNKYGFDAETGGSWTNF
ncbi:MAG: type VI secretion system tube protein Hcp [Sphingobacteriales bacterium]|nr:type VI secretion system tube protein Hcp [Sphingobacteriales bacterium]OJW34166.1 MAG: hypothetical protein BGO54_05745 [Sphingobacteriales bacterium 46-32]